MGGKYSIDNFADNLEKRGLIYALKQDWEVTKRADNVEEIKELFMPLTIIPQLIYYIAQNEVLDWFR